MKPLYESVKEDKNELTEFDILKTIHDIVTKYKYAQYTKNPIPIIVSKEIQALEGLLKLYNKEKEKNKTIKNARFYVVGRRTGKEAAQRIILKEYISIDKINEKIEKLSDELQKAEYLKPSATKYDTIQRLDWQINILEELKEE